MSNQLRNYLLTINNPTETDDEFYNFLKSLKDIKYFIFQREKGEEKGTEHFQIYIEFTFGKRFDQLKKIFPRAHIEQRQGSKTQAKKYCSKEDTRLSGPYEYGEFVEIGERSDLTDIIELVKNGATDMEIMMTYPTQFIRYQKNIHMVRDLFLQEQQKNNFRQLEVTYIFGDTGVGKTSSIMTKYGFENVYRVTDYNRDPFFSYNNQDIIIFDEFRSQFSIVDMLNFLDGYPLMLPSRYNNKIACYTKVFIISNIPLCDQYKDKQISEKTTFEAFIRRIHHVYNYNISKNVELDKRFWLTKPADDLLANVF